MAVHLLIGLHDFRGRALHGRFDRLAMPLVERLAQLGKVPFVFVLFFLFAQGLRRRVIGPVGLIALIQRLPQRPEAALDVPQEPPRSPMTS